MVSPPPVLDKLEHMIGCEAIVTEDERQKRRKRLAERRRQREDGVRPADYYAIEPEVAESIRFGGALQARALEERHRSAS